MWKTRVEQNMTEYRIKQNRMEYYISKRLFLLTLMTIKKIKKQPARMHLFANRSWTKRKFNFISRMCQSNRGDRQKDRREL
jgi:hypothetical protein